MILRRMALLFLCCIMMTACDITGSDIQNTDTVMITDALGRTVTVPENPERVAALLASYADLWMVAGGEVCATVDDAWEDLNLDLSPETVNLGATKSPSMELLFDSEPDLVIASSSTAADVEMLDTLEETGIPVIYLEVNCFEEYLEALDICTQITGRRDLYEEYGLLLQERIEQMKSEMDLDQAQKVLFLRASSGYIRAKNSEGSILGEMLAELGCINIADSDAMLLENLNIESILGQDPDHIFIVQSGDDLEGTVDNVNNMMEENPAWKDLRAVQEGNLHFMDKHLFNLKPNARWDQAYEQLISILQK